MMAADIRLKSRFPGRATEMSRTADEPPAGGAPPFGCNAALGRNAAPSELHDRRLALLVLKRACREESLRALEKGFYSVSGARVCSAKALYLRKQKERLARVD